MSFLASLIQGFSKRKNIKGDRLPADTDKLQKQHPGSWSIPNEYQGEIIICSSCGNEFTFTAKDKKEYYEKENANLYAKIHMCKQCYLSTKH